MLTARRVLVLSLLLVGACRWEHDEGDDTAAEADAQAVAVDADVSPDADSDATPASDAPAASAVISCGAADCPIATEICCYTNFPNITQMCSTAEACMTPSVEAACDGPEDCSDGDVCCVDPAGAACKPDGACVGATTGKACHTNEDCPASNNCHTIQFVPWPIC